MQKRDPSERVPRVSIVIAAYNVENYISSAIDSALNQTFTDREVIVVDDGSTDATPDRIRAFGDRVVFLEQPHAGAAAARNRGIGVARGELIVMHDADDVWNPTGIETALAVLDAHPECGFVTRSYKVGRSDFHWDNQKFWIGQANFIAYAAIVRRELYERHGLFDETLTAAMDWELWMRFIAGGERVAAVEGDHGLYRRHAGSITADHQRYLRGQLRTLERVLEKGIRLPGLEATVDIARGRVALIDGDRSAARGHFRSAVRNKEAARGTRVRALAFTIAPRATWRLYNFIANRRRKRGEETARRRAAELGVAP